MSLSEIDNCFDQLSKWTGRLYLHDWIRHPSPWAPLNSNNSESIHRQKRHHERFCANHMPSASGGCTCPPMHQVIYIWTSVWGVNPKVGLTNYLQPCSGTVQKPLESPTVIRQSPTDKKASREVRVSSGEVQHSPGAKKYIWVWTH